MRRPGLLGLRAGRLPPFPGNVLRRAAGLGRGGAPDRAAAEPLGGPGCDGARAFGRRRQRFDGLLELPDVSRRAFRLGAARHRGGAHDRDEGRAPAAGPLRDERRRGRARAAPLGRARNAKPRRSTTGTTRRTSTRSTWPPAAAVDRACRRRRHLGAAARSGARRRGASSAPRASSRWPARSRSARSSASGISCRAGASGRYYLQVTMTRPGAGAYILNWAKR